MATSLARLFSRSNGKLGLGNLPEAYLLLDPKNTTLRTKQVVATVIAHELAHQWFGDLVTMQWWDDPLVK